MGLSYDLISEFVKITNDKKENTKEGTVYATVVSGTGGKYVRIDGSDLLTPMDTTTDIEDGERVTLMIKDHKAIVTGNVTTPSASTSKVDKVTESVNSVSDRVGTFELVVADKVSTNELEAYKATIEVLIANKATIEDLTATNAKIENLEVKNAEIENLVAEKATIEDLEAVNATIENLKVKDAEIENAVVENLKATTADIKILNADFAQIKTLVNGNLTSDNILSFNLTSEKVTVDDAFIKDAMIDTISAGKINAGKINTNSVSIGSEDGGMLITGSTQQFTDKNGNVRIQIGKDASGDFTFILYGEDGQGQIINQNGITASAISDGLIVNDMVSDHAAISGGKLDISSVITEINGDNSTTINSSKIYLNDQAQSLEVAFNSLKTQVDTIQEVTIKGDLTAIVEQVQSNTSKIEANKNSINTLISEDTVIKKQVTDLQGTLSETETTLNSKYTTLSQNLDGFKTTVANTYATKKSVTDVVDNIEANYSTTSVMNSAIEQKAQEISASVSSTYATKNEVSTLDNNLRTNYSTTQQMESAINVAKEAINLSVSNTYETKENTTSKITGAINNLKIGGFNLITKKSNFVYGYLREDNGSPYNTGSLNDNQDFYTTEYIFVKSGTPITFTSYPKQGVTSTIQNAVYIHIYNTNKVWQRCESNVTSANVVASKTYTATSDCYVRFVSRGFNVYNHMAEFASKPSEWRPSPNDVNSDISTAKQEAITSSNNTLTSTIANYYTKSQTDSQINVAKEAINLSVSNTYETKTNVETKVTSTLNSAKSYADTKKSEAISTAASDATSKANTAKQEAITSSNNTLTSTIANYYTKSQTDSQINVAKEAINLSVSNTYETKTNTTSKINSAVNNIKIGGSNLISKKSNFRYGYIGETNGDFYNGDTLNSNQDFYTNRIFAKAGTPITFTSYPKSGVTSSIFSGVFIHIYNADDVWQGCRKAEGSSNRIASVTYTPDSDCYVRFTSRGFNDYNHMAEFATKPSEWRPSINDTNSDISTAKSEAITSANNTLTSTIANYYTKTQTDSQINVAKEAINLSVSNTYETKQNVETKVTSTLNSAKSYADTKKSEAISTAASDATSKINSIKIGGSNLIAKKSNFTYGYISASDGALNNTGSLNDNQDFYTTEFIFVKNGTPITFTSYPKQGVASTIQNAVYIHMYNTNKVWQWSTSNVTSANAVASKTYTTTGDCYVRFCARGFNDYNHMAEFATKPSEWTPAPEDIESDITSIESETKSIKQTVSSLVLGTDSISASVKSLEETVTNTTNGLSSDISRIQEQVNLKMSTDDVKLEIQKEMSKGANKVSTSTGFTFDENGLNVNKSDSEMRTQITEDGMKIYKNSDVMLTANNQGVDAKNLHATTYLIIGNNSRMEDFTENGSKRTAVFWIG